MKHHMRLCEFCWLMAWHFGKQWRAQHRTLPRALQRQPAWYERWGDWQPKRHYWRHPDRASGAILGAPVAIKQGFGSTGVWVWLPVDEKEPAPWLTHG